MIKEAIAKLIKKENLTTEMMEQVMEEIMTGEATDAQKASFLTAMTMKGETIDEITSAAKVMRSHCEKFLKIWSIRGCWNGGDGANTINFRPSHQLLYHRQNTGCKARKPCSIK